MIGYSPITSRQSMRSLASIQYGQGLVKPCEHPRSLGSAVTSDAAASEINTKHNHAVLAASLAAERPGSAKVAPASLDFPRWLPTKSLRGRAPRSELQGGRNGERRCTLPRSEPDSFIGLLLMKSEQNSAFGMYEPTDLVEC